MKKFILAITLCCAAIVSNAQVGLGTGFRRFDVGFGGAFNYANTDAQKLSHTGAGLVNFTYNYSPFINFVAEGQIGRIGGGDSLTTASGREFKNDYKAAVVRAQFQAGEILNYSNNLLYNFLKNAYIGTGVGYIHNNIVAISSSTRQELNYNLGIRNSNSVFIPMRVGYELKVFNKNLEPAIKFDIGYQFNYLLNDELDGFITGKHNDIFQQFSFAIKFGIGHIATYRKPISRARAN